MLGTIDEQTHDICERSSGGIAQSQLADADQTVKYTALVMGLSLAVALFLGALDYLFEYILKTFIIK